MFSKKFLLITIFLGLFLALIIPTAISETTQDDLASNILKSVLALEDSLYEYSSKNISVEKDALQFTLQEILSGKDLFDTTTLNRIVSTFRENGLFLEVYELLYPKQIHDLTTPFIVFLPSEKFCVVKNITMQKEENAYVEYISIRKDEKKSISINKFLEKWNNVFFSPPMENVLLKRLKRITFPIKNQFFAIYTHHRESNFNRLKNLLEKIRKKAKAKGWDLIYVDELGLIPQESVNRRRDRLDITQKKAFNQIKKAIFKEDEMLSEGIPIKSVNSPLYLKLYEYLAKHRITSYVEDLEYKLWKKIVDFDDEKLYEKAAKNFTKGDMKNYLENLEIYTQFFYRYNVNLRDKMFAKQLTTILKNNPNSFVFTIRGMAHYGLGKKINYEHTSIKTMILSKGKLNENFNRRTWIMTLWNNGVRYPAGIEEIEMAKTFIQDCVFDIEKKKGNKSVLDARRISYDTVEDIDKENILNLIRRIKFYNILGMFEEKKNLIFIEKIVYDWCKKEKFLEK